MSFSFGTKAATLERLQSLLTSAKILPQICFKVRDWASSSDQILTRLQNADWGEIPLIVRSSALSEDTPQASNAGHFLSIGPVSGQNEIFAGITQVVKSLESNSEHQVFIQPMLSHVRSSGVAFSYDPNTGGPYYVINYDELTHTTSGITSGKLSEVKTYYHFRKSTKKPPANLARVIDLVFELEEITKCRYLDIEFAFDNNDQLFLFQVRPLMCREVASEEQHASILNEISKKVESQSGPHPYLHGSRTIYGIMPDWNPAEIIGVRPRPLALSLYRELITDNIWAYQRDNYGYKNLRSFPLLVHFHGLPYIDVRVSFNSFLPADIPDDLGERLTNYYIDKLIALPDRHDKVEFDIVYSCYTLDLPERFDSLRQCGFSPNDCDRLSCSLKVLTDRIIHPHTGLWIQDIEKIDLLEEKIELILKSNLDKISKIYWLLEDCKRYGTLPFAGLARAAFIAVQFLRSMIQVGILSPEEYAHFMASLNSVSSRMGQDLQCLSLENFLKKYGHLRPGTYDILSPSYDEDHQAYFNWDSSASIQVTKSPFFSLSDSRKSKLTDMLRQHGIDQSADHLMTFIKRAIEGREQAKFIFTKSLSHVIKLITQCGSEAGFSKEECSYADINCLKQLYVSSYSFEDLFRKSVEVGRCNYELTQKIVLPPLIVNSEQIESFYLPPSEPNFITLKRTSAPSVALTKEKSELKDAILFIPSADPGYDWIFHHGIKGFITMYGGVNSHMAIRAGELGIPAVIGAGQALYEQWAKSRLLDLDCANRKVTILR